MRILGFSQEWPKLKQYEFTTFRFTRRDKDWQIGEMVQVVLHPRSPQRKLLRVAQIIKKESRGTYDFVDSLTRFRLPSPECISDKEAEKDGFLGAADIEKWLIKTYGSRPFDEPINRLTLRWVEKL